MGARPLRRAIQRYVEDPVADKVLAEKIEPGSTVIVDKLEEEIKGGPNDGQEVEIKIVKPKKPRAKKKTPVAVGAEAETAGDGDDHADSVAPSLVSSQGVSPTPPPRPSPGWWSHTRPVPDLVPGEGAAARVWTGNWQRMLPVLVAARGLVKPSMLGAMERFLESPQSLMTIEREFSTGDPSIVRAAAFELLHRGRIQALELHTESLSFLTRFVAIKAKS